MTDTAAPRPGFFKRFVTWPFRMLARLQPTPRMRKAFGWGAFLGILAFGAFEGSTLRSGQGMWIDMGIGAGVALGIWLAALLIVPLLRGLLQLLPATFGGAGFAGLVALWFILDEFVFPSSLAWMASAAVFGVVMLGFGSIAYMTGPSFKAAGGFRKLVAAVCLLVALGAVGYGVYWKEYTSGDQEHLVQPQRAAGYQPVAEMTLPVEVGQKGPMRVLSLTYGSGTDIRRTEFGEGVAEDLRTEPVDGSDFASLSSGWFKDWELRAKYWGFDLDEMPRNGRVWYPDGDGAFPLVLVVHGNHNMDDFSDPGYQYLGEHLASHGYITVSVDENFLNGSSLGGMRGENDARGWMLLKHLELWRDWNATEGHRFAAKVDMDKIALIGHSRGGEAVAHAAAFNRLKHYPDDATIEWDFGFSIRSLIAIAPADGQYKPAGKYTPLTDINYFTIHGAHDADVSRFVGDRQWDRISFTRPGPWFKSSLYVYAANHGQWNTVWGDTDMGAPGAWFLNRGGLMPGEEQRAVALLFFTAFLETTVRGREEYRPMFQDHRRVASRMPDTVYVSRYQDPTYRSIVDFEEDIDVLSTGMDGGRIEAQGFTMWKERDIAMRGGSNRLRNGVYLGWREDLKEEEAEAPVPEEGVVEASATTPPEPPRYSVVMPDAMPAGWALDGDSVLVLDLTTSTEKAPKPKSDEEDENENAGAQGEGEGQEESQQVTDEPAAQGQDPNGNTEEEEGDESAEEDESTEVDLIEFHIELEDRDGTRVRLPLSAFGDIPPVLKTRVMRLPQMESRYGVGEQVLQTVRVPLADFVAADAAFDPSSLRAVHFVFDATEKGVVVFDRIGVAR